MSLSSIDYLEQQKIQEVQKFERREQQWLEKFGFTYSERLTKSNLSSAELRRRQQSALRNREDISELPIAIDPDEVEF
jgi:N-acetylglutamate synthase-like GNAT family acetyltransferase